jgi:hypothetical protein
MEIKNAKKLAQALFAEHGLHGWTLTFDNAKRRFGLCQHSSRTISLSKPLVRLNEEHAVRMTLLHEIAHALVGPGHGHDRVWKMKAMAIGDDGDRCYSVGVVKPVGKYKGTCPNCGGTTTFFRKPRSSPACVVCCKTHNQGQWKKEYVFIIT